MEISNAEYQAMASRPLEEVLGGCTKVQQQEKKPRPHPEQALKCPRCDSSNTKFCYYNNYSLSQPRYFCKGCRRYWTQGGSLRNVPVGGGCRKNKRSSSSSLSKKAQDQALATNSNPLLSTLPPPPLPYDPSDLTLAFARLQNQPTTRQFGLDDHDPFLLANSNPNPSHIPMDPGFLDILRNGFLATTNPSSLHNIYYGFGGPGSVEEMDGASGKELLLPIEGGLDGATATSTPTTTSTCQGSCKLMDGGESKAMMGLQWHLAGDGNMSMDSGRDLWTGVGSWHGLINSSLL